MSLNLHLLKEHIDGGNIEVEFFPADNGSFKNFKGFALKIGGDVKEAFLIHESEIDKKHPLYNRFEGEINSGLAKLLTSGVVAGNELSVKDNGKENIVYQQSLVTMPEALLRLKQYTDENISVQSGENRYRDIKASAFVAEVAKQNGLDINELAEAAKPKTQGEKTTVLIERQNQVS